MSHKKIVIINPNSDTQMTKDIEKAANIFMQNRMEVITVKTSDAPPFIDSFEDKALAAPGMMKLIKEYEKQAEAFIVACHCDPNLDLLRELTDRPVIGIGEASMKLATMLGHSFSILSTDIHSVPAKQDLVAKYHLENQLNSILVCDTSFDNELDQYIAAGKEAIESGAEVIVLGCAGLCTLTAKLEETLHVPVLDGVVCALIIAEGFINADLSTSKLRFYNGLY